MKKLVSILLASMLLAVSVFAAADTEDNTLGVISPFYQYTENLTAVLTIRGCPKLRGN